MKGFPVVFDISGKSVVVVGAGSVATRRIDPLIRGGAAVIVVAPMASEKIRHRAQRGDLQWEQRAFEKGDLDGATLALATTDDGEINQMVARRARERKIPVGVADDPSRGDFAIPARVEFDHLRLTVDTGGAGPAISAALRRHLEKTLSPGWQRGARLAREIRPLIASRKKGNITEFWRAFAAALPGACEGEAEAIATWIEDLATRHGVDLDGIDIASSL